MTHLEMLFNRMLIYTIHPCIYDYIIGEFIHLVFVSTFYTYCIYLYRIIIYIVYNSKITKTNMSSIVKYIDNDFSVIPNLSVLIPATN